VSAATRTAGLVSVGPEDDFELDRFRVFEIEGRSIGVVRTARGFFAVRNRCPHQGADICSGIVTGTMVPSRPHELDYAPDQLVVVCPWHRWEFSLDTGRAVGGIANKRLVTYPAEVIDGEVHVRVRSGGRG
jgi:nitrite reductase/ring-hydroxylating ferredoxin subunit